MSILLMLPCQPGNDTSSNPKAAFILDARSGARSEFCSLQQLEKCGVRFSGASALNGAKSKNRLTRRFSRPVCEHLKGE